MLIILMLMMMMPMMVTVNKENRINMYWPIRARDFYLTNRDHNKIKKLITISPVYKSPQSIKELSQPEEVGIWKVCFHHLFINLVSWNVLIRTHTAHTFSYISICFLGGGFTIVFHVFFNHSLSVITSITTLVSFISKTKIILNKSTYYLTT